MKLKNCFVIFILVFVFSATTALASVIEYNDTTSFNAAISGATTYDFTSIPLLNALPPPNVDVQYTSGDATVGGVTFTAPSSTAFVITYGLGTFGGAHFFSGQGPGQNPDGSFIGPSNVTATLASGVTAIGFFYSPGDDAGGAIIAAINGVTYNLDVPTFNTIDFIGFTSDMPITNVAFTEQGYGMDITQFILGTANSTTSVPEPATMLLLGLGLMGLAGVRRKIKQ